MSEIAKKHADQLVRIKKNIEKSYIYFKNNYDRFHMMKRFVYKSNLTDEEESVLTELKKPAIEVNIINAFISRQLGEFSKQEPSIVTHSIQDAPINPELPRIIEGSFRKILDDANKDGTEYNIQKDLLGGGFSVYKIETEYETEKSFKQRIKLSRCYDPTLVGFDPLAQLKHKGDATYCFESVPMTREAFESEYPNVLLDRMSFQRSIEGYTWSYNNSKEDIILVCDYYEKTKKKERIVELSDGSVMTAAEYEQFTLKWEEMGTIAQLPVVINKRKTYITKVVRYRLIETQIIDYHETIFKSLPLIFVDGDSEYLRNGPGMPVEQFTKPYAWHAIGAQKMKNFATQTWANELENMVMQKWIVPKEAIPAEYTEAYTNPQRASSLVYNAFDKNNPAIAVPPPREVQRIPMPQEVSGAFSIADQTMQAILGSYDASLGINNNQLSGVAIVEGATQSNATAMPYIVGHLQALTQAANTILTLIPIIYSTQKDISILNQEKESESVPINQPNKTSIDFDSDLMKIEVKAGVNFAIQKSRALEQLLGLNQSLPAFAQFMSVKGLPIILDNLEIRGIDQLKDDAKQFMQQLEQQQQMQQKMQMQQMQAQQNQPNPEMIQLQLEKQALAIQEKKIQAENEIRAAKLALEKQEMESKHLKTLYDIEEKNKKMQLDYEKDKIDSALRAADIEMKAHDQHHRHAKETIELHANITRGQHENR